MAINIASRWRELSGENNWEGLMDPLDLDLRRYIIHYGERTVAIGNLFNNEDRHSLYPEDEFFSRAGLQNGNIFKYNVTNFIYAASDTVATAWFGYVAVTSDEGKVALGRRDILVGWRGTETDTEWINNALFFLTPASALFGNGTKAQVHSGFLSLYTGKSSDSPISARDQVGDAVRALLEKYQDEEISITVTGYSLGAALATLNAMDIVANGYNKPTSNPEKSCMVTAFTYGGPRVGNKGLKEVFSTLGDQLHILRITNFGDLVPLVPPMLIGYTHLGNEFNIDTWKSDYLKGFLGRDGSNQALIDSNNTTVLDDQVPKLDENTQEKMREEEADVEPELRGNIVFSAHYLDIYLHGVAGYKKHGFGLEVDHDIALVNKNSDRLKDKFKIPSNWWTTYLDHNNIIQMDNGHWKFLDQNA